MNDQFGSETPRPWNIYTSSDPSPSQTGFDHSEAEAPWKSFGTSMNAISFGFVATAILISMFLIMAIFEHIFRPNSSTDEANDGSLESGMVDNKTGMPHRVSSSSSQYASDFSVVMPGQQYPTYIAQPAPLPCPREGINWPSHQHNCVLP